ncbi:hypothetical protein [Vibrio rarus]|uniref:hypothetical protein n=1 Tax=Vibrio rarus TaxID=413403 RepID=UPI0021C32E2E|nr:hypothetical protein [Vibrio rarus]
MKALAEHGYIIEGIDSHQACLSVRKSGVSYQLTIQNAEDRQMKGLIILPL